MNCHLFIRIFLEVISCKLVTLTLMDAITLFEKVNHYDLILMKKSTYMELLLAVEETS